MTFKKAVITENKFRTRQNAELEVGAEHPVLINSRIVNAEQFKLVNEIVAFYNATLETATDEQKTRYAKLQYTRKELRDAHGALRNRKAAPYFVSKNVACKVKDAHGLYTLAVLKLAASEAKKQVEASKSEDANAGGETPAKKQGRREKQNRKEIAAPVSETTETADAVL